MAVINKDIAYMALPLSIRRGNPFPVDEYSVWYDMGELTTYATTSPVAYVGQIVTLVNEDESTVEAYMIQNAAGNLMKLASTTASGDLTEDVLELQGKVSNLETAVGTKGDDSGITANDLWAAIKEVKAAYEAADVTINEKFGNYYNKTETESKIDEKINVAISTTYRAAGSVAFEALPTLAASEEGKVYNISNEFTTTENFVEGAGKKYPVGTNVVCIDVGTDEYKWDVLAGFIDTSTFVTDTDLTDELDTKVDKVAGSSLVQDTLIAKLTGMAEIKSVKENELVIDPGTKELSVVAITTDKVTGLTEALEGKVNVEAGKALIEETLITKLQGMAEIKGVSEELEIGSDDKILSIKAIDQSKVTGLTAALAGKIHEVKVNEVPLLASDGSVNIGLATSSAAGVVMGSNAENKVKVDVDGTMEVNSLNINKLVQGAEDVLVLDGGDASSMSAG